MELYWKIFKWKAEGRRREVEFKRLFKRKKGIL